MSKLKLRVLSTNVKSVTAEQPVKNARIFLEEIQEEILANTISIIDDENLVPYPLGPDDVVLVTNKYNYAKILSAIDSRQRSNARKREKRRIEEAIKGRNIGVRENAEINSTVIRPTLVHNAVISQLIVVPVHSDGKDKLETYNSEDELDTDDMTEEIETPEPGATSDSPVHSKSDMKTITNEDERGSLVNIKPNEIILKTTTENYNLMIKCVNIERRSRYHVKKDLREVPKGKPTAMVEIPEILTNVTIIQNPVPK